MKYRCSSLDLKNWPHYGARGIGVCERWASFENFLADMGQRPSGMQLDRIDNDRGYEPSNCRWVTPKMNATNRRSTVFLSFGGEKLSVTDWAIRLGWKPATLHFRIEHGWSVQEALTRPLRAHPANPAGNRAALPIERQMAALASG